MSALSGSKAKGLTLKRFSIYSALKTNVNDLVFLNLVIHSPVASGEIKALSASIASSSHWVHLGFNRPTA